MFRDSETIIYGEVLSVAHMQTNRSDPKLNWVRKEEDGMQYIEDIFYRFPFLHHLWPPEASLLCMFEHWPCWISFLLVDPWCRSTWFTCSLKSKVALSCRSFAASKRFPTMHNRGIHSGPLCTIHRSPLCTINNGPLCINHHPLGPTMHYYAQGPRAWLPTPQTSGVRLSCIITFTLQLLYSSIFGVATLCCVLNTQMSEKTYTAMC